ncbi:hypothetical protein Acr_02g0012820 [Actinidia rufa]|uniref:Uncharacterized protein n=1 Tax=Actinidia rufa TaxID=165716 RepID=A0A7J0E9Q1_9ERIC|nr:hypothetical protein Acr_02g0012820 [Actinidia rufa]
MHMDRVDALLMALGFLGAIGQGLSIPVTLLATIEIMNNIGGASTLAADVFTHNINKNAVFVCYVACGQWAACFLGGFFSLI